ncbi:MAG: hypothetical protein AVDCRST_MAG01-01-5308, partial [uncultured Rubrobacteraceae bacterium]
WSSAWPRLSLCLKRGLLQHHKSRSSNMVTRKQQFVTAMH